MRKLNEKKMAAELERLKNMSSFENKYYEMGYNLICGVDEVGRGPLAGHVVACACILPKGVLIPFVNDSKKLSEKMRNELFIEIENKCVSYSIGILDWAVIDDINILQATKLAMQKAVNTLPTAPDIVLTDHVTIPDLKMKQIPIKKGDELSISIACASILAKVTRDKMMADYAKLYPEYGFESNKGYGTKEHIEAIKKHGLSPIHRLSFNKRFTVV